MINQQLPLEDTFGDILRKAMRGTGIDAARLARRDRHCERRRSPLAERRRRRRRRAGARASPSSSTSTAGSSPTRRRALASAGDRAARRAPPRAAAAPQQRLRLLPRRRPPRRAGRSGRHPANLLRVLRDGDYHLQYILITHKHARSLRRDRPTSRSAFPQAKIVMHALDVHAIGPLGKSALLVRDGETLPFGEDASIRMLHTPGHTDGSSCFSSRCAVFRRYALRGQRRRRVRRAEHLRRHPQQRAQQALHAARRHRRDAGSRAADDDRAGERAQPVLLTTDSD